MHLLTWFCAHVANDTFFHYIIEYVEMEVHLGKIPILLKLGALR